MDAIVSAARGCVRDMFVVAYVRAKADDPSMYIVQQLGGVDQLARSRSHHTAGDQVWLLLFPSEHRPSIIGNANLRAIADADVRRGSFTVSDFIGIDAAIFGNPDVVANLADAHEQEHSFTSHLDHLNYIGGAPTDTMLPVFVEGDDGGWDGQTINIVLDGGTR